MSWFQTSANQTEADKEHVCMFLAVQMEFPSGFYRFWSGIGNLTIAAEIYTGTGILGKINVIPENVRLVAERKTFQLSGVDLSVILESDLENCFGGLVTEYFGFIKQDGTLHATPEVNWEGYLDKCRRVDGVSPLVEVNAEHRLALIDKADGWRYTHEHQQQFYPGDDGFKEMPSVELTEVLWGGYRVFPGTTRIPGGALVGGRTR